jgi:hypothetical protein
MSERNHQQEPGQNPQRPPTERSVAAPDVVVEFLAEGGALLVSVRNVGGGCAHRVRVAFSPEFHGLGGTLLVPGLALFERLRFLGPGREVRALVDALTAYFGRGEPETIDVSVTFSDDAGRQYRRRLSHDLGIYRDLPQPAGH